MTLAMTNHEQETGIIERPTVSLNTVQQVRQDIKTLQSLVKQSLTRSIDYGRIPGTPADSLWEPGAAMIISAFNCYAGESKILSMRDDDERISVCLEVPIISRNTGRVVAVGVGAASTLETKHKYRWLSQDDVLAMGFDGETIATFKKKERDGRTEYRIPNPEHGELLNTILKMARKRGEVDAAEALPGVSSALRELFSGRPGQGNGGRNTQYKPPQDNTWTVFWGKVRQMGYTQPEAYHKLTEQTGIEVTSIKDDWIDKGHTLDEALDVLGRE